MVSKILGIDFDDTLVATGAAFRQYHTEQYGCSNDLFRGTEEGLRRGYEFINSYRHILIPAIEGAIETIEKLRRKCTLVIVTVRDTSLQKPTLLLMEKHFRDTFKDIHFLHTQKINTFGTKGDVCKKYNIEEFVDDSLEHAEAVYNAGKTSFLFGTPINLREKTAGIIRISNWKEILEYIQ
jgi:uncharacterized HAD superfamily protein